MKTIVIQSRTYDTDQMHKKLLTTGWHQAVEAYLDSLPEDSVFGSLTGIRKDFRTWKQKQKEVAVSVAWEQAFQEMLKVPTLEQAYQQMKATTESGESVKLGSGLRLNKARNYDAGH